MGQMWISSNLYYFNSWKKNGTGQWQIMLLDYVMADVTSIHGKRGTGLYLLMSISCFIEEQSAIWYDSLTLLDFRRHITVAYLRLSILRKLSRRTFMFNRLMKVFLNLKKNTFFDKKSHKTDKEVDSKKPMQQNEQLSVK